uniref:Uncharacterized protein n=1 Tax=Globisporangium ultimum (strain ATCC 200006 / CBS 805.95 / DAOM BR144) TaxID=431595 RepID=K3X7A8_GLOUD
MDLILRPSPAIDPAADSSTDSEEKVDEPMDSTVNVNVSNDDGTGDVPMLPPPASSAPAVDTRLDMAEVLRLQEDLRRDKAAADASRRRVEPPKPLAVDIVAIERQYAAGAN